MRRIPVSSSTIHSVGYDSSTLTLEIAFHTGWVYHYYNVPQHIYNNLMNASSKGIYHKENIKYSFRYKRIS